MSIALVDADVIVYTAGFGAERTLYKVYKGAKQDGDNPIYTSTHKKDVNEFVEESGLLEYELVRSSEEDPLEYALHKAKLILEKIVSHVQPKELRVFLTASNGNFREEIATYKKYKGNRDATRKPVWYHNIREYLVKYWNAEEIEGQEADDMLGILQTSFDSNSIICTTDKDLQQIPGKHYHLTKEVITNVGLQEGLRQFYLQAITGDSADNILGAPGIGPVNANKLLDMDDPWGSVIRAYKQAMASSKRPKDMHTESGNYLRYKHWKTGQEISKGIEDFALEQAQLVYIRKKEGEIWTPKM